MREAAARANGTAGVSVVFAGTTVLVSLLGLRLAGLPVYASVGFATLLVVGTVMLTSVTLVPALCGLAGTRVLRRRERRAPWPPATDWRPGHCQPAASTGTHRPLAGKTDRHRDRALGGADRPPARGRGRSPPLAVLLLLAAPVLGMRTWPQDAGSGPESTTTRVAYDLVAAEYGPGANGPFLLAVDLDRACRRPTVPT